MLRNSRNWTTRLLLCTATWVTISSTAYICAWREYRGYSYFRFPQEMTRTELERFREGIEQHREATGKLPAHLNELVPVPEQQFMSDGIGRPFDGWGHSLQYVVADGTYKLFSYGEDGKPGGEGLDADLYAGAPPSDRERLTLAQFMARPDAKGIQLTCLVAGAIAFPLFFVYGLGQQGPKLSLTRALVVSAITAIFAIFTAVFMSAAHLPSGH
jgi:hypothetical protein